MIMPVAELRQYFTTDESDEVLEAKLQALELMIRAYTNNNFQHRGYRAVADLRAGVLMMEALQPFNTGDTVQIHGSRYNDGLYTVTETNDSTATVKEDTVDESGVMVTKVVYPADIKMGVVKLLKWDLERGDKVGVASETISRHSVTYFDMAGDNSVMGYPKALLGFLRPYHRARFGQGVRV